MTPRRLTVWASLVACMLAVGGCRSDPDSAADATTPSTSGDESGNESPGSTATITSPSAEASEATSPGSETTVSDQPVTDDPPVTPATTPSADVPEDADELVLSETFVDDSDAWSPADWIVDDPGEARAIVVDGVGVMETDARGTHEWVRAVADGSTHDDATAVAQITPIHSTEGTVFIGLRGDGEWRDRVSYLPQVGAVVEYSYSPLFEGEIVLIDLDGPDERRIGPVSGPILEDGQSADIRFEVVGDQARVKIWRVGETEPAGWNLESTIASTDGGIVQIAYRDSVAQSLAWNELTLYAWP